MAKQKSLFDKMIQALTHTVDPIPTNLAKYDIVILGEVLGGILTQNFTKFTHGHKDIMYVSKSKNFEMNTLRPLYEQKKISKLNYFLLPVLTTHSSVAKPVESTVTKIDPKSSIIEFSNGRKIEYKNLVLDQGLIPAPEQIEGFIEALNDENCPVTSTIESTDPKKYFKNFTLFSSGDAYVYIPEFPFVGEVESYNFLMALDYIRYGEVLGTVSPLNSITIVNANDKFASHSVSLNKLIEDRLSKFSKTEVLYNTKITKINKNDNKLTLVDKNGVESIKDFSMAYIHPPSKANKLLQDAGLTNKSGIQVSVNNKTLQSSLYENIYSYGETADLPIQQTFQGSISQSHVVRHNILQQLDNRVPNAEYNGYSKGTLFTGMNTMTYFKSDYSGKDLVDEGWLKELWNYNQISGGGVKSYRKIYTSKKAGPPSFSYQKFPKGEELSTSLKKTN